MDFVEQLRDPAFLEKFIEWKRSQPPDDPAHNAIDGAIAECLCEAAFERLAPGWEKAGKTKVSDCRYLYRLPGMMTWFVDNESKKAKGTLIDPTPRRTSSKHEALRGQRYFEAKIVKQSTHTDPARPYRLGELGTLSIVTPTLVCCFVADEAVCPDGANLHKSVRVFPDAGKAATYSDGGKSVHRVFDCWTEHGLTYALWAATKRAQDDVLPGSRA